VSVAAAAVIAAVLVHRRTRVRSERRFEAVLDQLDVHMSAISESLEPQQSAPAAEATLISGEEPAPEGESLEELEVGELPPETPQMRRKRLRKSCSVYSGCRSSGCAHDLISADLPEEDLGWLDELETVYSVAPRCPDEATSPRCNRGLEPIGTLPAWLTNGPEKREPVPEVGKRKKKAS
jgi:hypothetical protein